MNEDSPASGVRKRLNELGVGTMPTDELSEGVMDHSPEAIGVRDLGATGQGEITDSAGNSWSGPQADALEALAGLAPGIESPEVWQRLVRS